MKKSKKTDTATVFDEYKSLDASSQCIAAAILQLAVSLYMGIGQVQAINKNRKED